MNWNWGIIYIWLCPLGEHLDFRTSGALPVTNGGAEIALPSSVTFYGVQGFFALLCDPAAKQLLFGLLPFYSHKTAFLTVPKGLKLLHQCQLWDPRAQKRPWGSVGMRSTPSYCSAVGRSSPVSAVTLLKKQTHHSSRPAGCLDFLLWAKIWGFPIFIESLEAFPSLAMEIFPLETILTINLWYHLVDYRMLIKFVISC